MASSSSQPRVCVTGAGGYIASWLVKLLLSSGYTVHATVRDPCDPKNACLKQLDKAPENLNLLKADMLDYDAVRAAFTGCQGVFHVASPVPIDKMVDKEREMMAPTVNGTMNVLKACSAMSVQKLIVVSSGAAVSLNPNWPQDKLKDESCWSDKEFCKENKMWYALAKSQAEEMALEYAEKSGLHIITFCPGAVFGPLLQSDVLNITTKFLRYVIKGGPDTINNKFWPIVDVRDVADALLLLYHKAGSSQRYICSEHLVDIKDLIELMKSMYPDHCYADKLVDVDYKLAMSSDKLKNLGWKARTLEETLADSIESYEKSGILQDDGEPCRVPYFVSVHLASPALSPRSGRLCAHSPTIRREPTPSQKPGLMGGRNLPLISWVWPPPVSEVGLNQAASASQQRGPNIFLPYAAYPRVNVTLVDLLKLP